MRESRGGKLVGIFGHLRPHLERQCVGGDCACRATPMNPFPATVSGTAKPALIAAEYLFVERGGIHGLIQAKEPSAGCDRRRVWIRRVADWGPRSGDLLRRFQCAPTAPTDDQPAIERWRVGQYG